MTPLARALAAAACFGLFASACEDLPAATPAPVAKTPLHAASAQIERRLGPTAFGRLATPHVPVAQIGPEAREVLVGPERIEIAEEEGVRFDGASRSFEIALPESVRALPSGSFELLVQEVPAAVQNLDDWIHDLAVSGAFKAAPEGWRLVRDDNDDDRARATLELSPEIAPESGVLSFRLGALLPSPAKLSSAPFDVPAAAAVLELGFGRTPYAEEDGEASLFRALLDCDGSGEREIVREMLPGDAAEWESRTVALPAEARSCRLVLETSNEHGKPVAGAFWAVPRIVARTTPPNDRSVVLISLDTLRADHLSGYGYERVTSPAIDVRVLGEGTSFTDASTTFPRTDVAHVSLFTSLYPEAQPSRGRVHESEAIGSLAESLRDAGWATAAFTEDAMLAGSFGFWFGFDRFVEHPFASRRRGYDVFTEGAHWLETHRDRPFFLFLHTYRVHEPYAPSAAYDGLFSSLEWWLGGPDPDVPSEHQGDVDRYDDSIREADALVAHFLDALDRLGLADRTLIVLLSDHGEAFGEHGFTKHGLAFHQEQLWIPLAFRGPEIPKGVRLDAPVSLVDVAPTILDLLGLPPLAAAQGESLAPAFRGESLPADRPLYFAWERKDGGNGVRVGPWKYVTAGEGQELFRLDEDPGERSPDRTGGAESQRLGKVLAEGRARAEGERRRLAAPKSGAPAISEETEKSLRALGYL